MNASARPDFHHAIREIDRQHAQLARLVEELSDSTIKSHDCALERAKLREVIDFTEAHFRFEEQVMASAGYRAHDRHADVHDRLLSELARWRETARAPEATDLFRLVESLWRWLLEHIDSEDTELLDWLKYRAAAAA